MAKLTKKECEHIAQNILPNHTKLGVALEWIGVSEMKLRRAFDAFGLARPGQYLQNSYVRPSAVATKDAPKPAPEPERDGGVVILERRVKALEKELREAAKVSDSAKAVKHLIHGASDYKQQHPKWLRAKPKNGGIFHGAPQMVLSDLHHGEVINAAQVDGVNEFNIAISQTRIRRLFERACFISKDVFVKSTYPGFVLPLAGDIVSGNIHDEIRETNDVPIFDAVLDVVDCLTRGIELLRKEFGNVFCPCVVGNHGRLDKKPRGKYGPQDNYEYILYHLLAKRFASDDHVTISISDSFTAHYRVYGTRVLLMHGDSMRGGSGISGPLIPWSLGDHKARKQRSTMAAWTGREMEYDLLVFGHFHQYFPGRAFVANGSVCGFNEYAKKCGFGFEPPQQAFWITNPERGVTFQAPVFAEDPPRDTVKSDDWVSVRGGAK